MRLSEDERIHVHTVACQCKVLTSLQGDPCKQGRQIMLSDPIQGTPQTVIMQEICGDALSYEMLHGLVGKKIAAPGRTDDC